MSVVRRSSERTLEVNGSDWPAQFDCEDIGLPTIDFRVRRARVWFEGGIVSVVWGSATYSDNHDHGVLSDAPFVEEPTTVEVGLFPESGLEVLSYVPADELGVMLDAIARGMSEETIIEAWKEHGGWMG